MLLPLLSVPLAVPLVKTVSARTDGAVAERRARRHRAGCSASSRCCCAIGRAAVVKRSLARLSIPLREPFATPGGVVAERELVLLRLEDEDGDVGYGEAAPFEPYDGVPLDDVVDAARATATAGRTRRRRRAPREELALLDLEAQPRRPRARRAGRRRDRGQPHAARRAARRGRPSARPTACATASRASS